MNNENPEKHKCLSCPTMIVEGDYCSECSDTPDGRSKLEFSTQMHIRSKYNKEQIQIHTEWPKSGPFASMNDSINKHVVEIINLKDSLVRKALIDLGWTPPPEKTTIHKTTACGPSGTIMNCSTCGYRKQKEEGFPNRKCINCKNQGVFAYWKPEENSYE